MLRNIPPTIYHFQDGTLSKNGSSSGGGNGSIRQRSNNPKSNSSATASNKSRPKYLECWGDADKPFANITERENNATAKSTALMVSYKMFLQN